MWDFFRSWRRKAACVALMIALVALAGLIRSDVFLDYGWHESGMLKCTVDSGNGVFACSFLWDMDLDFSPFSYWRTTEIAKLSPIHETSDSLSLLKNLGFSGSFDAGYLYIRFALSLPYWSLIGPSVGASAYLLLSTPYLLTSNLRRTAEKQSNEPAPTAGA